MKTKQLQVYSLVDFLTAYEAAYEEGFRMSTESGLAPIEIAGYYVATLVQAEEGEESPADTQEGDQDSEESSEPEPTSEESPAESEAEKPVVKRGRKPKA